MSSKTIHQCQCSNCQQAADHPDKELHRQVNLFLSRLDEQQRRWYVALEAKKLGRGGATLMSQVTGIHVDTIRRGREELDRQLTDQPVDRVRLPGGGRQPTEKKRPGSNKH